MKSNLIKLLTFTAIFFSGSCAQKPIQHQQNPRLISFQAKAAYNADEIDTLNSNTYQRIISNKFNNRTDTITYLKGKIYISYLRATSGCSDYIGDIQFNKDTIELLIKNKSDTVCSERRVSRLVYSISNKDNKQYYTKKY